MINGSKLKMTKETWQINATPDPALDAEPIKGIIGTTDGIWMGSVD